MASLVDELEALALKLSPEERADLADRLWISVASKEEVETAWAEEIERRVRELEAGEVETIPHEKVIAELRAKYG